MTDPSERGRDLVSSFERYMRLSACIINSSKLCPSSGIVAAPMLAVTDTLSPSPVVYVY